VKGARNYYDTRMTAKRTEPEQLASGSGGRTFGAHFVELRVGEVPAQMHPTA
jgi:hypothetical protein